MKLRTLGSTDLRVSAVGLGGMPLSLSGRPDETTAVRVRVAGLLATVTDERSMDGLWRGAESADFTVRLACARGTP